MLLLIGTFLPDLVQLPCRTGWNPSAFVGRGISVTLPPPARRTFEIARANNVDHVIGHDPLPAERGRRRGIKFLHL